VATYLSQEGFSPKHIARLLQRNKTFVTKSIHDDTDLETTGQSIPVSIYTDELSILEATCHYLRGKGLTNGEIADALGKSTSTIWVTLERADDKLA
jgi:DNA-binding CsgD family transcriptional regulator